MNTEAQPKRRRKKPTRPAPARRSSSNTRASAAAKRRTRPAKRKARRKPAFGKVFGRTFVLRLMLSIGAAAVLILLLMAILRVKTISIVGNSLYSAEEIEQASGVSRGGALLMVSKTAVASRIKAELPYIDDVRVGISLPSALKIEVVELETTYAVAAEDGTYWLINSGGRLVEQITAKAASEYLTVVGVRICNAEAGQTIEVLEEKSEPPASEPDEEDAVLETPPEASAQERMDTALQIIRQLEEVDDIRAITSIDVSSIYDLEIWYGTRFRVRLGDTSDLSYKLEYMVAALAQLESYQSGVLDLTFHEAKKATFIPWSS